MTYRIEVNYLEHSGGTKFYETVLIREDGNPDAAMLIKRYGKIDSRMGGGETLVLRGSQVACSQEQRKILTEKRKLRAGKGLYADMPLLSFGMHLGVNRSIGETELISLASSHYGNKDINAISDYFGMTFKPNEVVDESEEAVPAEPEARDDPNWGAW